MARRSERLAAGGGNDECILRHVGQPDDGAAEPFGFVRVFVDEARQLEVFGQRPGIDVAPENVASCCRRGSEFGTEGAGCAGPGRSVRIDEQKVARVSG